MEREEIALVDTQGKETVTTAELHSDERLLHFGDAIYTRHGFDKDGRKRFVFERSQRP